MVGSIWIKSYWICVLLAYFSQYSHTTNTFPGNPHVLVNARARITTQPSIISLHQTLSLSITATRRKQYVICKNPGYFFDLLSSNSSLLATLTRARRIEHCTVRGILFIAEKTVLAAVGGPSNLDCIARWATNVF